jgi:hypothetical protein
MKPRLKTILLPCVCKTPQNIFQCLSAESVWKVAEDLTTLGILFVLNLCFSQILNCMEHGSPSQNSVPRLGQTTLYRWMSNTFFKLKIF